MQLAIIDNDRLSAEELKRRKMYRYLMYEVKSRLDHVARAFNGHIEIPNYLVREFCFLQLRMLCELISLTCLLMHGDVSSKYSNRLSKDWSADKIMSALEKLKPRFYPVPVQFKEVVPIDQNFQQTNMQMVVPGPFPKDQLLALYGYTHKFLHRGNVRKILESEVPIDIDPRVAEIKAWGQKIVDHMTIHSIALGDARSVLCLLNAAPNGAIVLCSLNSSPDKVSSFMRRNTSDGELLEP